MAAGVDAEKKSAKEKKSVIAHAARLRFPFFFIFRPREAGDCESSFCSGPSVRAQLFWRARMGVLFFRAGRRSMMAGVMEVARRARPRPPYGAKWSRDT